MCRKLQKTFEILNRKVIEAKVPSNEPGSAAWIEVGKVYPLETRSKVTTVCQAGDKDQGTGREGSREKE